MYGFHARFCMRVKMYAEWLMRILEIEDYFFFIRDSILACSHLLLSLLTYQKKKKKIEDY